MVKDKVFNRLMSGRHEWKRVDGLPSVHTFLSDGRYYANLSRIMTRNGLAFHIDIDDLDQHRNDIVDLTILEGDPQFNRVRNKFDTAIRASKAVALAPNAAGVLTLNTKKRKRKSWFSFLYR